MAETNRNDTRRESDDHATGTAESHGDSGTKAPLPWADKVSNPNTHTDHAGMGYAESSPDPDVVEDDDARRLDPTRYGDWEKGGRCIDF